jgi:predicted AlkP superfamily phosphohydrolase/phosphomutase
MKTPSRPRVLVIGLDCAAPDLVFDRFLPDLPALRSLTARGVWGRLETTIPPITVPAWAAMTTGRDPGALGFYGFRNRRDHSYDGLTTVTSASVREPAVWDLLSAQARPSIVLGVPPSYPCKPLVGCMVSCFLTPPQTTKGVTYPADLLAEIEAQVGPYMFDVPNFRTDDKQRLARDVFEMTRQRFAVLRYLLRSRPWDFAMGVDMGADRVHHGFWKYFDRTHRKYESGHPLGRVIPDFYRLVDAEIGTLLQELDGDTRILVVSDHGAQGMEGGFCLNEWLRREGLLFTTSPVREIVPIGKAPIDWSRTVAWGDGGYYGRVFLNVKGREPQGVIDPADYEAVRENLVVRLAATQDEAGRPLGTRVYKPQEVYREVRGVAPDLIVHFGDLRWRSVGTLGRDTLWVFDNDTGPDDANHAMHGLYVLAAPGVPAGERRDARWDQIAPTLCQLLDIPVPDGVIGKPLL